MKRLFSMLALMSLFLVSWAQKPLVTLSHEGELSFFSDPYGLEDAISAAQNFDTIYLSEGQFTSRSNTLTIEKRLSIVGCGYKSHILPTIKISADNVGYCYMDAPYFEGVRLGCLTFSNNWTSSVHLMKGELRRCWIDELENGGESGKEILIDKCIISKANLNGHSDSKIIITNSKIGTVIKAPSLQVFNCNIREIDTWPAITENSIIASSYYESGVGLNGTATVYNSLFPSEELTSVTGLTLNSCYFDFSDGNLLDQNLECVVNLTEKGYVGTDGTIIGIHGGNSPFSENPSVPTVDSEKSSVEYDAESNKLKVTITVKPN